MLVSLAPLYYPDTLVNPDTCLGLLFTSVCLRFVSCLFSFLNVFVYFLISCLFTFDSSLFTFLDSCYISKSCLFTLLTAVCLHLFLSAVCLVS